MISGILHNLSILYQDKDILAVDKPAQLLSVPGKGPEKLDSVSYRLQQAIPNALIVHRLDWGTSGIMLFALHKNAQRQLNQQFAERQVHKCYIAEVAGQLEGQGEIDLAMRCDWENRPKQRIDLIQGKPAQTLWQVESHRTIDALKLTASRVLLFPHTGRSHQLRVHMQMLGHPILGDQLYADETIRQAFQRMHLHAHQLQLQHPRTGEDIKIVSKVPF